MDHKLSNARNRNNAKPVNAKAASGQAWLEIETFSPKMIFLTFSEEVTPAVNSADTHLSVRETQILVQLAKGYLMKEIADNLGIGFVTVRTYVSRIYKKLSVHSRAQAVARFLQSLPLFTDGREFKRPGGFCESGNGKQFRYTI